MFDTNISEAILHNDFLVDFFQQKTTSPTFTLPENNGEWILPKILGLKWPERKFHHTQTIEDLKVGEALAVRDSRKKVPHEKITTKITSIIGI